MNIQLFQVDSFTERIFKGNPAGVCLLEQAHSAEWMQNLALEMNLSETAFLWRKKDGFSLRWFTPTTEVELCGHATLASAHILFESGLLKSSQQARFHTASGLLTARLRKDLIELNFPVTPVQPVANNPELNEALGTEPLFTGKHEVDYLVEVASEETVRRMQPDFRRLAEFTARGVIVTSRSDSSAFDFVSRFFAPGVGINEDPVTGSAHCTLAPYWQPKLNKSSFVAYQASERGGVVHARLADERVVLGGKAVTVFRAELSSQAIE